MSHAAPTHHFGDLTGLVSELAAIGFRQFNLAMAAAGGAGTSPIEKAMAKAKAYVAYAQAHPGMYGLMFRNERLDMKRPSLHEAAEASFAGLAGAIGARLVRAAWVATSCCIGSLPDLSLHRKDSDGARQAKSLQCQNRDLYSGHGKKTEPGPDPRPAHVK